MSGSRPKSGVAYQKKGDFDLAMRDFEAAIRLEPSYPNAFANRGEIFLKQGDYARAVKDFYNTLKLSPDLGIVWNERCWMRAVTGELKGALTDCNEAIRLGRTLPPDSIRVAHPPEAVPAHGA